MVTAEAAILLPGLAVVLAGSLWLVAVVVGQVRCLDAAREAARISARGDGRPAVLAAVDRAAPGASFQVGRSDGLVTVTVERTVHPFGFWARRLPTVTVRSSATAAEEDPS